MVVGVEITHVLYQFQCLVVGVRQQSLSVLAALNYRVLHCRNALQLLVGRKFYIVAVILLLNREHLADCVQCAEVHSVGYAATVLAQALVGRSGYADIEQCRHQAGDILRHSAANGEDTRIV